jgi:hypothetical protein
MTLVGSAMVPIRSADEAGWGEIVREIRPGRRTGPAAGMVRGECPVGQGSCPAGLKQMITAISVPRRPALACISAANKSGTVICVYFSKRDRPRMDAQAPAARAAFAPNTTEVCRLDREFGAFHPSILIVWLKGLTEPAPGRIIGTCLPCLNEERSYVPV